MSLTRWDPFREMMTLREAMDNLFEESFVRPSRSIRTDGGSSFGTLSLDMYETEDDVMVEAPLPGFAPEEVDIELQNNVLTIKAEHSEEKEREDATYHIREQRFGRFYRQIALPTDINADEAEAVFEDGILKLQLPKAEVAKPKKITAKTK